MIDLGALTRMSEEELRGWLLRRMRGEEADPPISAAHLEGPDDYVAVVHGQTMDPAFRARLEVVIGQALAEVGKGDLRGGPDAVALKNLAELADRRELRDTLPVLQAIAERGIFGGQAGQMEPRVEEAVLFALAGLQKPRVLWSAWKRLWQGDDPGLWAIAVVGLHGANPDRAVGMLPEIVRKALPSDRIPLGEILWAFGADPSLDAEQLAEALKALSARELRACRRELEEVGATEEEIEEWLPAMPSGVFLFPLWAQRDQVLPSSPPRL